MNQGRIWCVVNPTVGLPLFLGGVATISLLVHTSVLTNTTWMANFLQGSSRARTSDAGAVAPVVAATTQGAPSFAVSVAPVPGAGETTFVVTITPGGGSPTVQTVVVPQPERLDGNTLALAAAPHQR